MNIVPLLTRLAPIVGPKLFKHKGILDPLARSTGTGFFKGRYLPVSGGVQTEFRKSLAGRTPWYNPKRLIEEPARHARVIKEHGVRNWLRNEWMSAKYHIDPATGRVKSRSYLNRAVQPLTGAGLVGGAGFGTIDLAAGSRPHKAMRTAAMWTFAPSAAFTYELGRLGHSLIKG